MKTSQLNYNKFVKYSDKIILDKKSTDTTVSISFLHSIRNHPEYLFKLKTSNYLLIAQNLNKNIKRIGLFLFNFISQFFYKQLKYNKKNSSKVLIISHLIRNIQDKSNYDFYFGNLQRILKKNKIENFRLLINHTKKNSNKLNFLIEGRNKDTIVLPKFLNVLEEFYIFTYQIKEFFRLIRYIKRNNNRFSNTIIKKAMISIFDIDTKFNLRINYQIRNFIKEINPKVIICTYEGFGWERLCFKQAKTFSKDITCIGYQHSPVTNINYALKRNIKTNYNPDIIWCSNKSSYKELISSKKLSKTKIQNIGNLKNSISKNTDRKKNKILKKNCLVIPEGFQSECSKLFDFSIQCARLDQSLKFILRMNPYFNFKINRNELPKNVEISKEKKLKDDIKKVDFVLYRGSGAAIESVVAGNIPIYLNLNEKTNIDPLIKFSAPGNRVNNEKEFIDLLNLYIRKKKKINKKLRKKIVNNYFEKLNIKTMIKSLKHS